MPAVMPQVRKRWCCNLGLDNRYLENLSSGNTTAVKNMNQAKATPRSKYCSAMKKMMVDIKTTQ